MSWSGQARCATSREKLDYRTTGCADDQLVDATGGRLSLSSSEQERISAAMAEAATTAEWDIRTGHKFFLCDDMEPTDFRKSSRGGIMGHRYFNLEETLPALRKMSLVQIADGLSGRLGTNVAYNAGMSHRLIQSSRFVNGFGQVSFRTRQ